MPRSGCLALHGVNPKFFFFSWKSRYKDSKKVFCFLRRKEIENYNVLIEGRNFYYQPINDLIKQYDEVRNISTEQGDDYKTGC